MAHNLKQFVQDAVVNQADEIIAANSPDEVKQVASSIAEKTEQYNPTDDKFSYRAVVIILGTVVMVVVVTYAIYALADNKDRLGDLPDAIISLGSAAVGALAGLLAPTPRTKVT